MSNRNESTIRTHIVYVQAAQLATIIEASARMKADPECDTLFECNPGVAVATIRRRNDVVAEVLSLGDSGALTEECVDMAIGRLDRLGILAIGTGFISVRSVGGYETEFVNLEFRSLASEDRVASRARQAGVGFAPNTFLGEEGEG